MSAHRRGGGRQVRCFQNCKRIRGVCVKKVRKNLIRLDRALSGGRKEAREKEGRKKERIRNEGVLKPPRLHEALKGLFKPYAVL